MKLTIDHFKNILIKSIYRTDFLGPRLKNGTKQIIVDQLFSRTILVGKETCRISHSELHRLTGISNPTISRAMRSLIKDGIVLIMGAYKPRIPCEYSLNITVPQNVEIWFSSQRDPWLLFQDVAGHEDSEVMFELNEAGWAVINNIKDSLSPKEKEDLEKKAREELTFLGMDLSEANLETKKNEILLRNFSEEKRKKYLKNGGMI